ncbi:restriction endonuclease subunit S [Vibrio cholerae]|uniref:restriction endonuclease subunit S n=1 Tax=Vibrio cholerae TaxID=666 RepID=UPI001E58AEEE|nr:restriction endonuclease subunit S [Vibrio cholerae]MCD1215504.1 restriction endonuclease subunit S [Vibrio cholerae]
MSWPLVKLGEVAPSKALKKPAVLDDDKVWQLNLDMVESGSGRILNKIKAPLSEAGSSTHWFDSRHVLYSKLRPYLNKVVLPDEQGLATTELVPMLPDPERLDRGFLVHYLRSKQFVSWISDQVAGAKMPRVSMTVLWDHEIPLPPLEEQKRIAAILDKADAIRQKRKQAIDLADEFLRSVFLDMFGDPVTNPKGWETKSLKEVSKHINDCPHSTPKWTDAGVICLRTSNLTKGGWNWDDTRFVSDETYNERSKRGKLEQGDIILSREGTVGIAALVPENIEMCMGQRLVQVRANREFVLPEYLLYLLLFELEPKRITRLMAGSTSKHINVRDLKQLKILLPSIDLQRKFVELMNKSKETTSSMVLFSIETENSSLALSQKAFSGQL